MVQHKLALLLSAVVLGSVVDAKMVKNRVPESLSMHRRAAAAKKDDAYVYSMNNPWQGFNATKWEPYVRYHARYMAINCPDQHDTEFFDACCKPRLAEKPDDSDYPKACSEAVQGAPQPDKAAAVIEAKIYAPLIKDGQVGFGGGAAANKTKTNPKTKKIQPNPKNTTTDADAEAKAKAAQEAADAKAKADQEAADAKAKADQEAAQKKAEEQKQAEAQKKAEQQKQAQEQQSNNDGGDDSSNDGGNSGGGGGLFSNIVGQLFKGGEATFYTQDGTTGACGDAVSDDAKVVALGIAVYGGPGDFSTRSKYCGKKVQIQNTANGKSVIATVNDGCPGCDAKHLDLSLGAYDEIGARDTGVLPITWAFIN